MNRTAFRPALRLPAAVLALGLLAGCTAGLGEQPTVTDEPIAATDEEKEAEYSRLAEQYGMKVEQVKAAVAESDLVNELKTKKAAEVVYSSGKVGEAEKPKKKAAPRKKTAKKAESEEPKAEGEEPKTEE